MRASNIESLEISLRGFLQSNPEDEKGRDFRDKMIRDIKAELKNLRGENVEHETDIE